MTDDFDTGHPTTAESPRPAVVWDPAVAPEVLVFDDVASLVESFGLPEPGAVSPAPAGPTSEPDRNGWVPTAEVPPLGSPAPASVTHDPVPMVHPPLAAAPAASWPGPAPSPDTGEVVTDEERTRYGLLLDSAAERGLLDPADYEIRLRELAEATTKAQMVEIVAELPAFTATATPTRSRHSIQSANRKRQSADSTGLGAPGSQRRRVVMWVVMGLVVVVALASLVILALSAQRLSRSRSSSPPSPPAAARPFSGLRL